MLTMLIRMGVFERAKIKLPEPEKPLVIKIDPDSFKLSKQIVQSEDGGRNEPVKGAYLSDKTRAFDRQTKARVTDTFRPEQRSERKAGGKVSPKDLKFSDLGAHVAENPFKTAAKEYSDAKNGNGKRNIAGHVSSTNDYVEDVPLGDVTNLNTVEYKYYGFYHRIRQKLEQFWGRSIQEKAQQLAKRGRAPASDEDLITALQITLDHEGEVIAIRVMGSSGIKELDDAAIESFNDAGPFPNPPKDLIVDGKVTLEWGFVIKS
jgi:TonB family protein